MLWIGFISEDLLKWSAKDWNLPFVVLVVGVYLYIRQCCEQKGKLIMIMQQRRFAFLGEKEKRLACKKRSQKFVLAMLFIRFTVKLLCFLQAVTASSSSAASSIFEVKCISTCCCLTLMDLTAASCGLSWAQYKLPPSRPSRVLELSYYLLSYILLFWHHGVLLPRGQQPCIKGFCPAFPFSAAQFCSHWFVCDLNTAPSYPARVFRTLL